MAQNPLILSSNNAIITGLPWVTSSFVTGSVGQVEIDFTWVTKAFLLANTDLSGTVCVSFTSGGFASGNFWTLVPGQTLSADVMVKTLYLNPSGSVTKTNYQLFAELTTTDAATFAPLSASSTVTIGDPAKGISTTYPGI